MRRMRIPPRSRSGLIVADRPRNDDWWLASDGKWYPPELSPADSDQLGVSPAGPPRHEGVRPTEIPKALTNAITIGLVLTSSLLIVAGYYGFRVAGEVRDGVAVLFAGQIDGTEATSNEVAFSAWLALALLVFAVTGVLAIVWTFQASRAFDHRGATARRWRGGWTIGAWFIPFASVVLPKFVFNELERLSVSPTDPGGIGDAWRAQPRSTLGDLWWGLWIAGVVVGSVAWSTTGAVDATDEQRASSLMLNSVGLLLMAGAGVAFVFVIRRIAVASAGTEPVSLPEDRF